MTGPAPAYDDDVVRERFAALLAANDRAAMNVHLLELVAAGRLELAAQLLASVRQADEESRWPR